MTQRDDFFNLLHLRRAAKKAKETKQERNPQRLQRCPYRQDMRLFCGEVCGKGEAVNCPIWLRESGLLAESLKGE